MTEPTDPPRVPAPPEPPAEPATTPWSRSDVAAGSPPPAGPPPPAADAPAGPVDAPWAPVSAPSAPLDAPPAYPMYPPLSAPTAPTVGYPAAAQDPYGVPTQAIDQYQYQVGQYPVPQPPEPANFPPPAGYQTSPTAPYSVQPYSQQPYSQQPYGQPPMMLIAQPNSGMATASMVFGIVGLVFGWCMCGIPSLIAIILGHIGMSQTRDGRLGGRGMAIAGLVMGYILIIPTIILTFFVFSGALFSAVGVGATSP